MKPYRRNFGPNRRNNRNTANDPKPKKSKKLDMRKSEEFNYMLGRAVDELPESVKGAIRGSIYAIASKKGAKEAKDFIGKKRDEGIIDGNTQKRLVDLVFDYSKYR